MQTTPEADRTCFEVVWRPLDGAARPRLTDETSRRFKACIAGFYDPELWAPGREMTAVGTRAGTQTGTVVEVGCTYARMKAEQVYL